jgi:glycopeptide antibiotics resistance protein
MIKHNILNIINLTWPMIAIAVIILVSIRITWLCKNKGTIVYHREIANLLFLVYILLLFQVVTFQDVSWSTSNFIPFREITRYQITDRLFIKNVLGNLLIFVPYGFFVSYYLNFKKVYQIVIMSIIASFSIEYTQLIIGRVFDVDDIMLNILGAIVGYLLYRIVKPLSRKVSNMLKNLDIFTIIRVILLILVIFLYIYKKY